MTPNTIHTILRYFYPLEKKMMPYQVYAYLALGAVNTLFNIVLFALCYRFFAGTAAAPWAVETATVISFATTVVTGFWLHKNFAFTGAGKEQKEMATQLGKYFLVSLQGQVSGYLLTKALIVWLLVPPAAAYGIAACIMITLNYFLQKYFTFRPGNARPAV